MRYFSLFILLLLSLHASTLHLATSTNPSRLNPLLATDSSSSEISDFIFSSLVKYDKDSSTIIGDLAESFHFENPTTLIFKLHPNILWQDGVKFSAKDVVFTYNLINSKDVVSPYTAEFRMVKSVEALDERTIKVVYKKPYFKALETWMMGILPEHILKNEKNLMSSSFNTHPIGTGAYKLTQLEHSKDIILTANANYFLGKPKIEKIIFHVIPDPMTRFLMLKSSKIDVGSLEAMEYERQVDKDFFTTFKKYEDIAHTYSYLGFNLRNKKFQDPRVREALSLAIDRDELVKILFLGHGRVCSGPFLPTGAAFNKDVKAPKQNLQRAKELLKQAGYDEKHPLEFEIATSNSSSIRPYAAQIMQYQLQKVGVHVSLRIMEWQAFLNMVVFPRKFETVLLGWSLSSTPDPYLLWHSDNDKAGGFNFVGYHNKKVDKEIEVMQESVDVKQLSKLGKSIFADIVADNAYLFLFIPNDITVANKKIKNIEPSPSGIWHNYKDWKIDTER
jgi:peptide/nickel transport system substrate-binding protein